MKTILAAVSLILGMSAAQAATVTYGTVGTDLRPVSIEGVQVDRGAGVFQYYDITVYYGGNYHTQVNIGPATPIVATPAGSTPVDARLQEQSAVAAALLGTAPTGLAATSLLIYLDAVACGGGCDLRYYQVNIDAAGLVTTSGLVQIDWLVPFGASQGLTSWVEVAAPAVPLPAAFPLLLVAVGGLGVAARRRKAA